MRKLISKFGLFDFLTRAGRDQRGVSAVVFAISFAVLTPMALGIFDVYQTAEQRGKLQDALDASALYAAKSSAVTNDDINTIGNKALAANLELVPGATLNSSSFALTNNTLVTGTASVALPAYAPLAYSHLPVTASSQVTRGGNNIEVAMVLDNSTSMAGASLTSLKSAANQLIDLVVSDSQTPFYSKVSIIPYGNGVNVGTYANTARGAPNAVAINPTVGSNNLSNPYPTFQFKNASNTTKQWNLSTCVSERTGPEAYSDAPPSTALVGTNYPAVGAATQTQNPCISAQMAPLTSVKTDLHSSVNALTSCCSTAGHVGVAWGWYTLSPRWNSVFTGGSAPASYTAPNTIKALILMTDGEYNSVYCNGVIAKIGTNSTATTGSGDPNDHIGCLGTNGADAYAQAQSLCTAMKATPNNVVIYTVGLNLVAGSSAQNLVNNCATDAKHVYMPANGAQLQVAFQQIAANLNKLRISH